MTKKKTGEDDDKVEVTPSEGPALVVDSDLPHGHVRFTLSQHWTNPETGLNHKPGDTIVVSRDDARGLEGAGYGKVVDEAVEPTEGDAKK